MRTSVARAEWLGWGLGALCALTGCDASVEPIEVAAGCPDRPLRGPLEFAEEPADRLIDDFEDGDDHVAQEAGRDGQWIIGMDSTAVPSVDISSACAARGARAGHFVGSGFTNWGANWTAVFRAGASGTAVGYDGTSYTSLSFWAAVGPEAEPPYDLPVGVTTLDVAWNGGVCSVCMDFYRRSVALTPEWQRFDVPFAELAQIGEGNPLTALRRDQLVGFILWPTHAFDIWIDDVRFEP